MIAVATGTLARLRATVPGLTPALQRIAEYALEAPEKVIYHTVTELAEAAHSSEGSVIRFCKDLGFSGFQDFKLALATDLAAAPRDKALNIPGEQGIITAAVQHAQTAIRETAQLLELSQVEKVVAQVLSAERIDVYGVGASGVIAHYVEYKLLRLGLNVQAFVDPHLAAMSAARLTGASLAIGVSSSGSVIDTVYALQTARAAGAFTVALTNRAKSPMTATSSAVLLASNPESPLTGGAIPSKIGQLLVLDVLFSSLLSNADRLEAVQKTAGVVVDKSY